MKKSTYHPHNGCFDEAPLKVTMLQGISREYQQNCKEVNYRLTRKFRDIVYATTCIGCYVN